MNAQTAKITPVAYTVRTTSAGNPFVYIRGQKEPVCGIAHTDNGIQRAHLIAEAFNVYHETGLTPRQLADQRAELLEALKMVQFCTLGYCSACDGWMVSSNGCTPPKHTKNCPVANAIARATGEQP